MTKTKLRRMIDVLEMETAFRKAAVMALVHAVKPTATFRFHYLMYAVENDFVSADVVGIDKFFRWSFKREDSEFSRNVQGPLTREEMLETFDEYVPSRKGMLEEILRVDRSDGEMGVWHKWANLVLGPDSSKPTNDDVEPASDNDPTTSAESKQ